MKNILVTIAFDENDELLIEKSFQLAKSFQSKLWLLHIAAPDPDFVGLSVGPQYIRDFRASELREELKILDEYASDLKKKGIDTDGLLIQGSTIETILFEAEKLQIDLIVLGHHKYSFLQKAFTESVAKGILDNSKVPMLIIPLK